MSAVTGGPVIAIDGKVLRSSGNRLLGQANIKAQRLKAGWDAPYLLKVLFGLSK